MRSVLLGLAACASIASGCVLDPPSLEAERTAHAAAAIQGGQIDDRDKAAVAVANTTIDELCTGSRIGPNLVLTAAHCVSKTTTTGETCPEFLFGGVVDATNVFVTDATTIPPTVDGWAIVSEIRAVPSSGESLCDRDLALLILASADGLGAATPLVPRLDGPVVTSDAFSAIGYGQSGLSAGIGTRRRLDGLAATCVPASNGGEGCNESYAGALEWIGHAELAHTGGRPGDSGSPAIDASGEVIGVFLRHLEYPQPSDKRDELVYASLEEHAKFLRDGALHAASLGDYDAPAWVVVDDADGPGAEGCAIARRPQILGAAGEVAWVLTLGVGIALLGLCSIRRSCRAEERSSKRTPSAESSQRPRGAGLLT